MSDNDTKIEDPMFVREIWSGDSRDGALINGDGYHYFKMSTDGLIVEAYEFYENDDGIEVVTPLPEMEQVHWIKDLGFEDFEILENISFGEYKRIKEIHIENL